MIEFRKGKRYSSLLSDKGRVLHIHHTGPAAGEIHFDKPFWKKTTNVKMFCRLLSNSYNIRNLQGDIRVERIKERLK